MLPAIITDYDAWAFRCILCPEHLDSLTDLLDHSEKTVHRRIGIVV